MGTTLCRVPVGLQVVATAGTPSPIARMSPCRWMTARRERLWRAVPRPVAWSDRSPKAGGGKGDGGQLDRFLARATFGSF